MTYKLFNQWKGLDTGLSSGRQSFHRYQKPMAHRGFHVMPGSRVFSGSSSTVLNRTRAFDGSMFGATKFQCRSDATEKDSETNGVEFSTRLLPQAIGRRPPTRRRSKSASRTSSVPWLTCETMWFCTCRWVRPYGHLGRTKRSPLKSWMVLE